MSDTETQAVETRGGVTGSVTNTAVVRRSISMKNFRSPVTVGEAVKTQTSIAAGQIVGAVYAIEEKIGTLPNGDETKNLSAVGRFEATVYETGEVISAQSAFLPKYYLESLRAMLAGARVHGGSVTGMVIAVEIVTEPTGLDPSTGMPKSPAYAWVIKDLRSPDQNDPLAEMKRQMMADGTLRLPAPPPRRKAAPAIEAAPPPIDGEVDHLPDPAAIPESVAPSKGKSKAG
jgi:hypothetical protein